MATSALHTAFPIDLTAHRRGCKQTASREPLFYILKLTPLDLDPRGRNDAPADRNTGRVNHLDSKQQRLGTQSDPSRIREPHFPR